MARLSALVRIQLALGLDLKTPREATQRRQDCRSNQTSADPSLLSEVPPSHILFSGSCGCNVVNLLAAFEKGKKASHGLRL